MTMAFSKWARTGTEGKGHGDSTHGVFLHFLVVRACKSISWWHSLKSMNLFFGRGLSAATQSATRTAALFQEPQTVCPDSHMAVQFSATCSATPCRVYSEPELGFDKSRLRFSSVHSAGCTNAAPIALVALPGTLQAGPPGKIKLLRPYERT